MQRRTYRKTWMQKQQRVIAEQRNTIAALSGRMAQIEERLAATQVGADR